MQDNKQPKVQVRNLTKKFGDLLVLNDVSFNIRKGEFLCVVGPTGCGKTTFLNLLTRLIEPTSGQLLIDGEPADTSATTWPLCFRSPPPFPGSRWNRTSPSGWASSMCLPKRRKSGWTASWS